MSSSLDLAHPDTGHVSPLHILALDPGETTGIAYRMRNGAWRSLTNRDKLVLYQIIAAHLPPIVVCESFDTQARLNSHSKYTIAHIGGIEAICLEKGLTLVYQRPQHRYPCLAESQRLHEERDESFVIHQVDAFAHLLRYEERKRF